MKSPDSTESWIKMLKWFYFDYKDEILKYAVVLVAACLMIFIYLKRKEEKSKSLEKREAKIQSWENTMKTKVHQHMIAEEEILSGHEIQPATSSVLHGASGLFLCEYCIIDTASAMHVFEMDYRSLWTMTFIDSLQLCKPLYMPVFGPAEITEYDLSTIEEDYGDENGEWYVESDVITVSSRAEIKFCIKSVDYFSDEYDIPSWVIEEYMCAVDSSSIYCR